MSKIHYYSTIKTLMYAMVCNFPHIEHLVGVVGKFHANPRKQHWKAIKLILGF